MDMRECITPSSIATQVRLLHRKDGAVILVEDSSSSIALTTAIVDQYVVRLVVTHGKSNLTSALNELSGESHVLAVSDADYDRIAQTTRPRNLVWFEFRDLEIMIICSGALVRYGEAHGLPDIPEIRDSVLSELRAIGAWRAESALNDRRWSFAAFRPDIMFDAYRLTLDVSMLRDQLQVAGCDLQVATQPQFACDSRDLVRGHDASAVLAKVISDRTGYPLKAKQLEADLVGCLRFEDIKNSGFIDELRELERVMDLDILVVD